MMIKGCLLTLVTIIWGFKVYSQDIIITGKVVDKQSNTAVQSVDITFYAGTIILYKTVSDIAGTFSVQPEILKQTNRIKISSVNYNEFTVEKKDIKYDLTKKNPSIGTFKIDLKEIELNEVKIKSKRRYRDTARIDLSKENFERSVMIDDIFSKSFGFSRDAAGQLYYKGKPVSNIAVNGGDFFGKNNMDVYRLLPALILSRIDVVETNIDSITNTTMLRPSVSINLNLKDKFDKGKFGNTNLGAGSENRYVANADLYAYIRKEQLSLSVNSNNININDNSIQDPKVNFSTNGNNATSNAVKFNYRNVYDNRITVELNFKARELATDLISESDRRDEALNISSKVFNSSDAKSFNLDNSKLSVNYQVDSLNVVNVSETFNHFLLKNNDSSNYNSLFNNSAIFSRLLKQRNTTTNWLKTKAEFIKRSKTKRGRLFTIDFGFDNKKYNVNEFDNVFAMANQVSNNYFIQGERSALENNCHLNFNFTEPISIDGYLNFFLGYERDKINYSTNVQSDTTVSDPDYPATMISSYINSGIKFQHTYNKYSITGNLAGIFNPRTIDGLQYVHSSQYFDINMDLGIDYKISTKKNLVLRYKSVTDYPDIQQLFSINSTFDLLSQNSGNIDLKPEKKKSFKLTYNTKPSDSETIEINGELEHFGDKFGISLTNSVNTGPGDAVEKARIDNVGKSNAAVILVSVLKNTSDNKLLNFSTLLSYQGMPSKINNKLISNNGLTISQSLSTSFVIVKSLLTTSPVLSLSFSKFSYETNSFKVATVSYSDSFLITTKMLQIGLYPLFTYNKGTNNVTSFSMNGALKKSFLKDYCAIWLQAYDIFNSFRYINNYVSASGYGSVKFNNLNRYFILGFSLKFNNMK